MTICAQIVNSACRGYEEFVNSNDILDEAFKNIYDGIPFEEVFKSIILSARTLIEKDPAYAKVSAQLLLYSIRKEVLEPPCEWSTRAIVH